jgi:hypothetical protein
LRVLAPQVRSEVREAPITAARRQPLGSGQSVHAVQALATRGQLLPDLGYLPASADEIETGDGEDAEAMPRQVSRTLSIHRFSTAGRCRFTTWLPRPERASGHG